MPFILELLQNADDNSFEKARRSSILPFVSFRVYETRIVVDCNEDGFLEENVRGICGLGVKRGCGHGYIGEKGMGFKSVFKVAWKVHIQSSDYSSCLKHRPGESGVGMTLPEWEEFQVEPTEVQNVPLTRMTLFLHEWDDQEARDRQRKTIRDQLGDIQPAMLIFMKSLEQIKVAYFDEPNDKASSGFKLSITSARSLDVNRRIVLEKRVKKDPMSKIESTTLHYHVTSSKPRKKSENLNQNKRTGPGTTTNVVLVFPLSEDSRPIPATGPRDIYAFSTFSHARFNFFFNASFDMTPNRDEIDISSTHNKQLRLEIVYTFFSAVEAMLDVPELRYRLVRYLPNLAATTSSGDPFWNELARMLKEKVVGGAKLFLAETSDPLARDRYPLRHLGHLSPSYLDQNNTPLFKDLDSPSPALCISSQYQTEEIDILRTCYDLQSVIKEDILSRVKADLKRPTSRMKSTDTSNDWHSRAAKLLRGFLKGGVPLDHVLANPKGLTFDIGVSTRDLPLLPLSDGRWISITISQVPVYLPNTDQGFSIPDHLGFCLFDSVAARNPDRKQLFVELGVQTLSSEVIRKAIFQHFKASPVPKISITTSMSYLRFLYETHSQQSALLKASSSLSLFDKALGAFSVNSGSPDYKSISL